MQQFFPLLDTWVRAHFFVGARAALSLPLLFICITTLTCPARLRSSTQCCPPNISSIGVVPLESVASVAEQQFDCARNACYLSKTEPTILGIRDLWRAIHPRMEQMIRCWLCRAACWVAWRSTFAYTGGAANWRSIQAGHIRRSCPRARWQSGDTMPPRTKDGAKCKVWPFSFLHQCCCLWAAKQPRLVQVIFSAATLVLSASVAYQTP